MHKSNRKKFKSKRIPGKATNPVRRETEGEEMEKEERERKRWRQSRRVGGLVGMQGGGGGCCQQQGGRGCVLVARGNGGDSLLIGARRRTVVYHQGEGEGSCKEGREEELHAAGRPSQGREAAGRGGGEGGVLLFAVQGEEMGKWSLVLQGEEGAAGDCRSPPSEGGWGCC